MSTLAHAHDTFDLARGDATAPIVAAHLAARRVERRTVLVISLFAIAIAGGLIAGHWDRLFPQPDLVTFAFRV